MARYTMGKEIEIEEINFATTLSRVVEL